MQVAQSDKWYKTTHTEAFEDNNLKSAKAINFGPWHGTFKNIVDI